MTNDCRLGDVFNECGDVLVCREFCAAYSALRASGAMGRERARMFAGEWFRYLIDGVAPSGIDPPTLRLLQFGPETTEGRPISGERAAAFLVPGVFVSVWHTIGSDPRHGDAAATMEQDAAADRLVAYAWLGEDFKICPAWWGAVRDAWRVLRRYLAASALVFRPSSPPPAVRRLKGGSGRAVGVA